MTKNEAIDILYTQLTVLQCKGESDRHTNDAIDAIRMAIESLGTNVAYICDEDACVECGQEFSVDCIFMCAESRFQAQISVNSKARKLIFVTTLLVVACAIQSMSVASIFT